MSGHYKETRARGRTMTFARARARTSSINFTAETFHDTDPFGITFEDDDTIERRYTSARSRAGTVMRSRSNTTASSVFVISKDQSAVEAKTNWRSIYILTAIATFNGVQFSVFFASLWPFLDKVDHGAGETFFGVITSVYCLGQTVTGPLFGMWMNKAGSIKPPLATGVAVMALANVLYAFVEAFPEGKGRWAMLAARLGVGLGSGCLGVMRAYGATASTLKDRARAVTFVSASFVVGLTIGPGLQVAFTPIGYPGWKLGPLHIDEYTAPAIFAVFIDLISLFTIYFIFQEEYAGLVIAEAKDDPYYALPNFKKLPAAICIITQFSMMFVITNTEAIGSMYSIAMFDWTDGEAVKYTGIIQAVGGVVSLVTYLAFAYRIGAYVSQGRERIGVIIGISCALAYHVITFPYPFLPQKVDRRVIDGETVGCQASYDWCSYTHKEPFWLYAITNVIAMSLAFPIVNISMNTLYSKILGSRQQGTMQSIQLMAGSLARTIGPLLMTSLFKKFGPELLWGIEVVVLTLTIGMWLVFYRKMVPLELNPVLKPGEYYKYERGYKYRF